MSSCESQELVAVHNKDEASEKMAVAKPATSVVKHVRFEEAVSIIHRDDTTFDDDEEDADQGECFYCRDEIARFRKEFKTEKKEAAALKRAAEAKRKQQAAQKAKAARTARVVRSIKRGGSRSPPRSPLRTAQQRDRSPARRSPVRSRTGAVIC